MCKSSNECDECKDDFKIDNKLCVPKTCMTGCSYCLTKNTCETCLPYYKKSAQTCV